LCEKCTNECDSVNQHLCSGNSVKTCIKGSDGCNHWKVTDCPAGTICSGGECAARCTNECSASGRRECYGNGYRTCNMGSDGCYHWGAVTNCASDETCNNGSCANTCTNECSSNGQRVCSGNGWKQCGNHDSDSCLEWGAVTSCASDQSCNNGSCLDEYDAPTVNLTSTGDGSCDTGFTLKWISTDANSCTASGAWSGSLATNGSKEIAGFDGTKTFTIKCWGKGGTATDTITLTGNGNDNLNADAGSDKTVDEGETVKLDGSVDGDYDDIEWECNGGDLSSRNTLRPTFEAPSNHYDYDKVYTCTLTASNECGEDSDTVKIRVNAEEEGDLNVTLNVNPDDGCADLNDVDLKAEVDDDSNNNDYKYFFDCENDGDWDKTVSDEGDSYTANNLCDYDEPDTYTAKVKVTSNGRTATDSATIEVRDCESHEAREGNLSITKTVQNVSTGADYQGQVFAQPGQVVGYKIVVKAVGGDLTDVTLTDRVPDGIINVNALIVDGKRSGGDIESGIDLGDINEGDSVVVTYLANVARESNFGFGQNSLTNTATAFANGDQATGQATVVVSRQAVYAATTVSTGFDGGSGALIAAGIAGLLVIAGFALKSGEFGSRKKKSELEKKIDFDEKKQSGRLT